MFVLRFSVALLLLALSQGSAVAADPSGPTDSIQYNAGGGAFGGDAALSFDAGSDSVTLAPSVFTGYTATSGGGLFIDNTSNCDSGGCESSSSQRGPAIHLYSNAGEATSLTPLMKIMQDLSGSSWNQPGLLIQMDSTHGGATHIRLDGPVPQIEFIDNNESGNAAVGKYEIGSNGDFFYVAGRAENNSTFERVVAVLRGGRGNAADEPELVLKAKEENSFDWHASGPPLSDDNALYDAPQIRFEARYDSNPATGSGNVTHATRNWHMEYDLVGVGVGEFKMRNDNEDDVLIIHEDGMQTWGAVTFASLGTPPSGSFAYCSDCTQGATCSGSGSGAFARRINGTWICS